VSSFDPDLGFTVDRNVGTVKIQGVDAQIGQRLGEMFELTASAAFNDSELQDDVPLTAGTVLPTAGKKLVETPEWTYSARADVHFSENAHVGLQGKYVDVRWGTDLNNESVPSYIVVDLDVSYTFRFKGTESAEVQFNVSNLLDEEYFGNISSGTGATPTSLGFYSIGAPRTVMGSVKFVF